MGPIKKLGRLTSKHLLYDPLFAMDKIKIDNLATRQQNCMRLAMNLIMMYTNCRSVETKAELKWSHSHLFKYKFQIQFSGIMYAWRDFQMSGARVAICHSARGHPACRVRHPARGHPARRVCHPVRGQPAHGSLPVGCG